MQSKIRYAEHRPWIGNEPTVMMIIDGIQEKRPENKKTPYTKSNAKTNVPSHQRPTNPGPTTNTKKHDRRKGVVG